MAAPVVWKPIYLLIQNACMDMDVPHSDGVRTLVKCMGKRCGVWKKFCGDETGTGKTSIPASPSTVDKWQTDKENIQRLVAEAVESGGIMLVKSTALAQLRQRPEAVIQTSESRVHDLSRRVQLRSQHTQSNGIVPSTCSSLATAFTLLVRACGMICNCTCDRTAAMNNFSGYLKLFYLTTAHYDCLLIFSVETLFITYFTNWYMRWRASIKEATTHTSRVR